MSLTAQNIENMLKLYGSAELMMRIDTTSFKVETNAAGKNQMLCILLFKNGYEICEGVPFAKSQDRTMCEIQARQKALRQAMKIEHFLMLEKLYNDALDDVPLLRASK